MSCIDLRKIVFAISLVVYNIIKCEILENVVESPFISEKENSSKGFRIDNIRFGKFFGIGIVRFANNVCISSSGNLYGTCYTRRQCNNIGGVASGTCSSIGVCCVILPALTKNEHFDIQNTYRSKILRDPKQFFFGYQIFEGYGIVRFANTACVSSNGRIGTCLRRRECLERGGSASGSCASDIGVCCLILRTCGETSTYNGTYFTNANYPLAQTGSTTCTMTIQPCSIDFCQVRIDFLSFSLAPPDFTGVCNTDALIVTGGAGPVPVICGENTGQHIYVNFNRNQTIQLIVTTNGGTNFNRVWNFLVTQIACACPTRAPTGCLQFYNSSTGTVNSFNYGTATNVIDPSTGVAGTRELVFESYGVCVEMQPGYCGIQWSSTSFMVSGNANGLGIGALNNGDCNSDFVVIPNPYYVNGMAANTDRFCGLAFTTVTSYTKPFVLYIVTNGDEVNDTMNLGFSMSFSQLACNNALTGITNILG